MRKFTLLAIVLWCVGLQANAQNHQITIYQHGNFQGASKSFGPGRYDINELGIGNDQLSSLRIPQGMKVTLYADAGFQGRPMEFTQDANMPEDFNDMASSLVVERMHHNGNMVTIYQHENFGGLSKSFGPGRYNINELGIGNDQLSSVKVPPGMRVTLYADDSFHGAAMTLDGDTNAQAFLDNNFNDVTSSLEVSMGDAVEIPVAPVMPVATVVSNCEMNPQQFDAAKAAIDAQAFRDSKMSTAKLAIKNKCLSIDQIRTIAGMFGFEDQTLDFVKYAYDFTNSKSDYYTLSDIFSFKSNVDNFNAFLNSK